MVSISARLHVVKADPAVLLDPASIERACIQAGHSWRDRRLGPLDTLHAMAVQMLHGNAAISHVVRLMGDRFCESAFCQARARLPVAVTRTALKEFLAKAGAPDRAGERWKGHRVVLMDGTGVSVPDTPSLRAAFGVANGVAAECGLPCPKLLTVFSAGDGMLLDMHIAPACTHDLRHAADLHPALRPGDVLVGDRGLCAYVHLVQLAQIGCHGLFRMQDTRSMPFPARRGERRRFAYGRHRHAEPILVSLVARDDQVVEIVKPHNRPKHMTPDAFASIPGKLIVRAVRFTAKQPGRVSEITLLTTLIDAEKYSAEDLADLYLMRWRVEVNLRHLKRTLGMDRLKCGSIDGVTHEALMLALIYNAVCHVRALASAAQALPPTSLSFVDTLRVIRIAVDGDAATGRSLLRLPRPPDIKAWPARKPRPQPRQLKRAHSQFRVMTRPRSGFIRWIMSRRRDTN